VLALDHAVAILELRREEGPDPGFEQDLARAVVDQERAAGEGDAPGFVRREPAAPQRARRIAEHRAAVQALAIAGNGARFQHRR